MHQAKPPAVRKYGNNSALPGQGGEISPYPLMRWLWENSKLVGLRKCHRVRFRSSVDVFVDGLGGVWFGGFCRCHSVWACPMCAPAIRGGRARELGSALRGLLVDRGGGALHSTYTVPHHQGDRLSTVFDVVTKAWGAVCVDKSVREIRGDIGMEFTRSTEVTVGGNGWHPHLHVGEVSPGPLCRNHTKEYREICFRAWCSALDRLGWSPPDERYGLSMSRADASMGDYVSKVQGLADELLRLDTKSTGKTEPPFLVLRRAVAGDESAHRLWSEYEVATKGRRALSYSGGFRKLCPVVEAADDELLAAPVESWRVGGLDGRTADLLSRHPHGFEGFVEMVGPGTPEALLAAVAWLRGTSPLFLDPAAVWEDLKQLGAELNPQPEQLEAF